MTSTQSFMIELNEFIAETGRSVAEIADELRVSRPTVERWTTDTSAPHPGMQVPIREYFRKKIEEKRNAALQGN